MHEHFDIDGEPCIAAYAHTTVVTREPEWDEQARGRALHLAAYERSIDKTTGLPISEAFTNQGFLVHSDVINYAARAMDKLRDADRAKHENDPEWMLHRTYYVTVPDPE